MIITIYYDLLVSFSKPYDVVVTDVRADSAVIHWKTTERSSSIERFKASQISIRVSMHTKFQTALPS